MELNLDLILNPIALSPIERIDRMLNPFAASVAREPFAWPGGYERFAYTDDGATLCHKCCKVEYGQIATAYDNDGWKVVGVGCEAEIDGPLFCTHCNATIVECWRCESEDCHGCED
jgi:hypothetical protein